MSLRCKQVVQDKPRRRCGRAALWRGSVEVPLCDEHAKYVQETVAHIYGIDLHRYPKKQRQADYEYVKEAGVRDAAARKRRRA